MKRVNYTLDSNNIVIEYHDIPFNFSEPWIEIDDNTEIHIGFDKVINGKLVINVEDYNEYREKQETRNARIERIQELKRLLANSDYMALKYADGALTAEEYAPMRERRQAYRNEINLLEKDL